MLYIFRGVPGSGKSTAAKKLAAEKGIKHFEADMFFMKNGEYKFDVQRLSIAHAWCWQHVGDELMNGKDVIVANTSTKFSEFKAYLDQAETYASDVTIYDCTGQYGNVHNVPEDKLNEMRKRYQNNVDVEVFIAERYPELKVTYITL